MTFLGWLSDPLKGLSDLQLGFFLALLETNPSPLKIFARPILGNSSSNPLIFRGLLRP